MTEAAEDARPTAVGAYIFAGGFTIGVGKHFRVLAHLEASQYGVASSQRNFPGLRAYTNPDFWPLDDLAGRKIDFLYCNPPCAPWSQAGATMKGGGDAWRKDPRLVCWRNCFVAFERIQPKVLAIESVTRALTAGAPFIEELSDMARLMGYAVSHVMVDAKNHDMAQKRKRYFFVCHRVTVDFDPPPRTRVTVNDLLATVSSPGHVPRWKDKTHEALVPHLPAHASFRALWERFYDSDAQDRNAQGGVVGRPRIFIHRVDGEGHIGTITGDYFVHPTLDRFMGINELKVLNGFPEDYWLEGNPAGHFSLISRGVCPPVAEWLAGCVSRGVAGNEPAEAGTERVIDLR